MRDAVLDALAGEEAYAVGGALRDELLGRPVLDLDVVCADPEAAARKLARVTGGAPFPLSAEHGGWRVVLGDGRTVDFTPLHGTIEEDLGRRDFTMNALAQRLGDDAYVDPLGGRRDIESRTIRHVSEQVFDDDPVRLLRAAVFADSLDFQLDPETERLVRARAGLVARGAGPTRSAFLSAFFTLVGCHGLHVTAGLLWLLTMMAQVFAKGYRADILRRILCFTLFWHFLDIVWVALFTVVYLMGAAT
jgi:tRNA nucleotidyltransferase/poly(A) polymerase